MKIRKITSLTAMVSFVVLLINSVVLYITPQGRVAYWADWHFWGLTKTEWGDQHIVIGVLFLLAVFLHIYYNWKPITSYLKNKAAQLKLFTREFNLALVLTVICIIGSYFTVPPFSWILDFGESIKDAAAVKYGEPPYGHAELSSLKGFSRRMNYDLAAGMARLKKAGIRFENEKQTLKEIAESNHLSPQQVFLALKPPEDRARTQIMPDNPVPGTGKRTVNDICRTYGLDLNAVMKGLVDHHIQANADMTLKEIGIQNSRGPQEIYELIKKISETKPEGPRTHTDRTLTGDKTPTRGVPSGLGRKTVAEVCQSIGIGQTEALKKLAAKGIIAGADDKMKELAGKHGLRPIDLYEIMK